MSPSKVQIYMIQTKKFLVDCPKIRALEPNLLSSSWSGQKAPFQQNPRSHTKNGHSLVISWPIHLFFFLCKWMLVTMPLRFMIIFRPGFWFRVDRVADGFLTGIQNLFRCRPNLITKIYIPHMTPNFFTVLKVPTVVILMSTKDSATL